MINLIPSNSANLVAPFSPLGRQSVGQENNDLKRSSFKALEQSAPSARNENRPSAENSVEGNEDSNSARENLSDAQLSADSRSQGEPAPQQLSTRSTKEQLAKDQLRIRELSARDSEVRAHEQAHVAVGGQYVGAPTYQFVRGPDGVSYAVSGEVSVSTSPIPNDPEATIRKAQQLRAAATAPADPSGQDRSVAAAAASLEAQARAELSALKTAESQEKEKAAERDLEARSAEEAKKSAESERLRDQERREVAREEENSFQRRSELARDLARATAKNININRHLVEIGVVKGLPLRGNFFDRSV
jgi:hypothetical protein